MQRTQINPAIFQSFLDSAANAAAKGQAQWFTPTDWARVLGYALPSYRPVITDLTCGNGSLLAGAGYRYSRSIGCDIDGVADVFEPVQADVTRFYSMLTAVKFEADLFVLNPPWDLHWYRDKLEALLSTKCAAVFNAFDAHDGRTSEDTIDSTVATLCMALDRCSRYGEGLLIANEATLQRLILSLDAPHHALKMHIWHHMTVPGNICEATVDPNSEFQTGIIYFARSHLSGPGQSVQVANIADAERHCRELQKQRLELRQGPEIREYLRTEDSIERWNAAAEEWNIVQKLKPISQWNLWLTQDGKIATDLSLFDKHSERVPKAEAAALHSLNGHHPMALVMQKAQRTILQRAAFGGTWRVAPAVIEAVNNALAEYERVRAPLVPLSKVQRLGYLDENEDILCETALPGFKVGKRYKLRTESISFKRQGEKVNIQGGIDAVEWEGSELAIFIENEFGVEKLFMEDYLRGSTVQLSLQKEGETARDKINFTLQQLVDNFHIPEVPDVAAARPDDYKRNLELLDLVEQIAARGGRSSGPGASRFKFKKFQREDYARAVLHDGLILGHDTGGGKGLALFALTAIKVGFDYNADRLVPNKPVLFVVPGDLHLQVQKEGLSKFGARVISIDKEKFLRLSEVNPLTGRRTIEPGFYITSYTDLSSNDVRPFPEFDRRNVIGIMHKLGLDESTGIDFFNHRGEHYKRGYEMLNANPSMSAGRLMGAWQEVRRDASESDKAVIDGTYNTLKNFATPKYDGTFNDLDDEQQAFVLERAVAHVHAECAGTIGSTKYHGNRKMKCVYDPSFADLCQDTFEAVAVDEGVKMKGEDTIIGMGVRQMTPRFKLVLTATPIKNRLPDIFRLAWWATGALPHAHARFPYSDSAAAREDFSGEFMVSEQNLSKRGRKKRTPQVCNIHRLWKLFAPIILRRRKRDFGEDIVPKTRHVVRVPMGLRQAQVYKFHLDAEYLDRNDRPAIGAQLQALRIAAANPASHLLERPEGDRVTKGEPRSHYAYVPKVVSALQLIHQILNRGEQFIVFSAFHDSLDAMAAALEEAGVRHCLLDGRTSQTKRGIIAEQFKLGPPKISRLFPGKIPSSLAGMLAGVECMAEGYSFPYCNNIILMCYSWALDKFEQAINRAHRLNSIWPVNIYAIICDGSIDRKLESMVQEKGDAAELVLDGKLMLEHQDEVNLFELLQIARDEFSNQSTIDEESLLEGWPNLRKQLAGAMASWRKAAFVDTAVVLPTTFDMPKPKAPIVPVDDMNQLKHFASTIQLKCLRDGCHGEEGDYFRDVIKEYAERTRTMPHTYQQDGMGKKAIAYLHYFAGGAGNWYITEKDKGCADDEPADRGKQHQAFGWADPFGDPTCAELGYIGIEELITNGAELDLHFTPKPLDECLQADKPTAPLPSLPPGRADVPVRQTSATDTSIQPVAPASKPMQKPLLATAGAFEELPLWKQMFSNKR